MWPSGTLIAGAPAAARAATTASLSTGSAASSRPPCSARSTFAARRFKLHEAVIGCGFTFQDQFAAVTTVTSGATRCPFCALTSWRSVLSAAAAIDHALNRIRTSGSRYPGGSLRARRAIPAVLSRQEDPQRAAEILQRIDLNLAPGQTVAGRHGLNGVIRERTDTGVIPELGPETRYDQMIAIGDDPRSVRHPQCVAADGYRPAPSGHSDGQRGAVKRKRAALL